MKPAEYVVAGFIGGTIFSAWMASLETNFLRQEVNQVAAVPVTVVRAPDIRVVPSRRTVRWAEEPDYLLPNPSSPEFDRAVRRTGLDPETFRQSLKELSHGKHYPYTEDRPR